LTQEQFYLIVDLYTQNFLDQLPKPPQQPERAPQTMSSRESYTVSLKLGALCLNFLGAQQLNETTEPKSVPETPLTIKQSRTSDLGELKDITHVRFHINGRNLDAKDRFSRSSDPFLVISRLSGKLKVRMYKTEVIPNNLNPQWSSFVLPVKDICHLETLIFECIDFDNVKNNEVIGSFETTLEQLLTQRAWQLINLKKKEKKGDKYTNSGVLEIEAEPIFNQSLKSNNKNEEIRENVHVKEPMDTKNNDVFAALNFKETAFKLVQCYDGSMFLEIGTNGMLITGHHASIGVKNIAVLDKIGVQYYTNVDQEQRIIGVIPNITLAVIPCIIVPMKVTFSVLF